jgi:glucose dehydrogenase
MDHASVDADLGLVYLEAGNAVPQWGGELRPGNNLFNNSVVALELKTGKVRWHYQTVHHDIWEHDLSTPLVLYESMIGGRLRKVLVAIRTDGISFFLDRETGKPMLPIEGRPGARTVIMSLWSVEDTATRRWMQTLYRGRLERGLDTAEAVRAAGLAVLRERRAQGGSGHPFFWAAFVAAGDWR